MIIAVPGETKYTTAELLELDDLYGVLGATQAKFRGATILLAADCGEQLPLYLRSEMAGRLVALGEHARSQGAAIIIPDVVQRQLFRSEVLYPEGIKLLSRDDSDQHDTSVKQAVPTGTLGILEKEKLLLLELLLGKQKWSLESVVHILREDKVFCLKQKAQGLIPVDRHYIIVKFDSAAAIDREVRNFNDVKELLFNSLSSQRYDEWFDEKVYKILEPHGHERDLFKVLASTVKTVGAVKDWTSQTLSDRWDEFKDSQLDSVITSVFATLEDLYRSGLDKQSVKQPSEVSIENLYDFYKHQIMPVDCVVKCELNDINISHPEADLHNGLQGESLPFIIGQQFDGEQYAIEEIKIRKKDSRKVIVSLICSSGQSRVEFVLGRLGDFARRREIYRKNFVGDGKHRYRFRGKVYATCESRFRENFEQLEFTLGNQTEEVVKVEDFDRPIVEFIDGQKLPNPFHIYREIARSVKSQVHTKRFQAITTYCHGDLNAGNIIATEDGDSRIIDFARLAKHGPLEFDFVELELDLRIRNLVKHCSVKQSIIPTVQELFAFERGLLKVFTDQNEDMSPEMSEPLQRGFRAIRQIRKKAISLYEEFSNNALNASTVLLPYMTAVFFESLAVWTMDVPGNKSLAKTWALIAGTVACEQLVAVNNTTVGTSA